MFGTHSHSKVKLWIKKMRLIGTLKTYVSLIILSMSISFATKEKLKAANGCLKLRLDRI
jgi:hypothetical protein